LRPFPPAVRRSNAKGNSMAEDLAKRLREAHANSTQRILGSDIFEAAADLIEQQAASLVAKDKEIARLRAIVSDCAKAIGNGAGVAPSSSIEFIELLPGEIAMHTDKLRRFLRCARDEGTEALGRAEQAERALAETRAHLAMRNTDLDESRRALAEAVEVMRRCENALSRCYNVTEWPADGSTDQDKAAESARAFVAQHGSDSREGK